MARYYHRRHYGHRRGRTWTHEEDEQLVQLWEQHMTISQIAQKLNRERDAIVYRLPKVGISIDGRSTQSPPSRVNPITNNHKSNKSLLALVIIALVILVLVALVISYHQNQQSNVIGSIFSSNNTVYLTQNQLFGIYGVGAYGSINTGSKETVNGSSLDSFISSGTQLASSVSIPSITFIINTSISNISIDNSFLMGFNVKRNGQEQVVLKEEVLSSPQASYLFFAQSQLATYDGYVNGMQYYVINNTEVIANKDNYVIIFKCEGVLCTGQTINETVSAVSKDAI